MRNLITNEKKRTPQRREYFVRDIPPYGGESGHLFTAQAFWKYSFRNCVLGLLRAAGLGFCPPLAREARCIPVFSHCHSERTCACASGRARRCFVSASCCPTCQKYWPHFEAFELSDEAKSHSIHTYYGLLQNLVALMFDAPDEHRATLANAFADSNDPANQLQLFQEALSSAFRKSANSTGSENG